MTHRFPSVRSFQTLFVFLHRWLGLVVGLHFLLLALTGMFMAAEGPMEAAFGHVSDVDGHDNFGVVEVVGLVQKHLEVDRDPMQVRPPQLGSKHDWRVRIDASKPGEDRNVVVVRVDSGTGAVVDVTPYAETGFGFAIILHHELFLDGKIGKPIVAVSGILCLLITLTGLFLWWPKGRQTFKKAALPATARMKNGYGVTYELHRVIGLYAVVGLLIITVTGVVIEKPDWFGVVKKKEPPGDARVDFSRLQQSIEAGGHLEASVRIRNNATLSITLTEPDHTELVVDPTTYAVSPAPPRDGAVLQLFRVLHFGRFGDGVGKLLVFLLGAGITALFGTAVVTWVLRWRKRSTSVAMPTTSSKSSSST